MDLRNVFLLAALMCPVFCRVPRQVSGTGSVSAELGRRLRHLHHAGDRSAVASTPGGVRPTLQNTGREVFRRNVRMKTFCQLVIPV